MKPIILFLLALFIPVVALAQASMPVEIPVDVALGELLKIVGGMKGFSALGIAMLVTQAVMLFFRTPLANFAGKWKLLIASGVAIVASFLGLLASGVEWKLALVHGTVLAAVNVFLHQLVKQVAEKPAAPSVPPAAPPSA